MQARPGLPQMAVVFWVGSWQVPGLLPAASYRPSSRHPADQTSVRGRGQGFESAIKAGQEACGMKGSWRRAPAQNRTWASRPPHPGSGDPPAARGCWWRGGCCPGCAHRTSPALHAPTTASGFLALCCQGLGASRTTSTACADHSFRAGWASIRCFDTDEVAARQCAGAAAWRQRQPRRCIRAAGSIIDATGVL